jgi:Domain of unknown function (DUF4249)
MKISFNNTSKSSLLTFLNLGLICLFLTSCEDIITLNGPKTDPFIVVDGNITNVAGEQIIRLTNSQDLLNEAVPTPLKNAIVKVTDDLGKTYEFKDAKNEGIYKWIPSNKSDIMGSIGRTYSLEIQSEGDIFKAVSKINRVPKIDSIAYKLDDANGRQKGNGKPDKGYEAQFYANDLKGVGDCYRIKVYKNDTLLAGEDNIVVAYDGLNTKNPIGDGIMFIIPLRNITRTELFEDGDRLKVELLSITEAHYDFWIQFKQELNNAGLFARPAARIPSNITNTNPKSLRQASGWFGTSAISSLEVKVDKTKALKEFYD